MTRKEQADNRKQAGRAKNSILTKACHGSAILRVVGLLMPKNLGKGKAKSPSPGNKAYPHGNFLSTGENRLGAYSAQMRDLSGAVCNHTGFEIGATRRGKSKLAPFCLVKPHTGHQSLRVLLKTTARMHKSSMQSVRSSSPRQPKQPVTSHEFLPCDFVLLSCRAHRHHHHAHTASLYSSVHNTGLEGPPVAGSCCLTQ